MDFNPDKVNALVPKVLEAVNDNTVPDILFVFDEIAVRLFSESPLTIKEIKHFCDWRAIGILKAVKDEREKDGIDAQAH